MLIKVLLSFLIIACGSYRAFASTACFFGTDTATQGNWPGIYGTVGKLIQGDACNVQPFATLINVTSQTTGNFAGATSDPRGPFNICTPTNGNARESNFWASSTAAITFTVTPATLAQRQIELYFVDWVGGPRAQTVTIKDAATGDILDIRNLPVFSQGVWMRYKFSGTIIVEVAKVSGNDAVLTGIFFE